MNLIINPNIIRKNQNKIVKDKTLTFFFKRFNQFVFNLYLENNQIISKKYKGNLVIYPYTQKKKILRNIE